MLGYVVEGSNGSLRPRTEAIVDQVMAMPFMPADFVLQPMLENMFDAMAHLDAGTEFEGLRTFYVRLPRDQAECDERVEAFDIDGAAEVFIAKHPEAFAVAFAMYNAIGLVVDGVRYSFAVPKDLSINSGEFA
jgi:hypothetical protein